MRTILTLSWPYFLIVILLIAAVLFGLEGATLGLSHLFAVLVGVAFGIGIRNSLE